MEITKGLFFEYLEFYKNKNFKPDTIQNFRSDFTDFYKFLQYRIGTTVMVEDISFKNIEEYKILLGRKKTPKTSIYYGKRLNLSERTIQTKIQAIKNFLKFTNYIYSIGADYRMIEIPRANSKPMDFLEVHEVKRLIDVVDVCEKHEINRLRAKLLITVGFTSGLRLGEILNIKASEIMNRQTTIFGKGHKERIVFFNESSRYLLSHYLEERKRPLPWTKKVAINNENEEFAIISHHTKTFGQPISRQTICGWFKKYNQHLELEGKKVSSHVLRHSFATSLLDGGANIMEIKELLGHSDVSTTQRYTHIRNDQLKTLHSKTFGFM